MTEAAQLLGGPKVVPARGPGKDQPPTSGEEASDFGNLLAAVEQLAELQAEGVIEIDANGLPVPTQGEAVPELGSLIASLEAARPEILDAEAGAQTFVPRTLGQRGRAADFRPLDLSRPTQTFTPTPVSEQTLQGVPAVQPAALQGQQAGEPLQGFEILQQAAQNATARTDIKVQLPEPQTPKIESTVAATPRLEAALQQQGTQETSNPVVRQLAQNVQTMVRGDMERMRFDLYPEELGRVSIQMQKTSGATKIMIVTETPQAFEALQRGASGLQQSLSQAGFDADEMTFEQHSQRGEREAAEERRDRDERRPFDEPDDEKRVAVIRPAEEADQGLFL
ncbi:MAG: flagellar hook-length control protein FliK [Pseudomonadota bacterium]